jgi:hypothetical protein
MSKLQYKDKINGLLAKFSKLLTEVEGISKEMSLFSKSTSNQLDTVARKMSDVIYRCKVKDSPPK